MRRTKLLIIIPLSVVFLECFIASIHCTNGKRPIDDDQSQPSGKWNDVNKIKLLKIFYQTDTGFERHAERIKAEWDRINRTKMPESKHNLYMRALTWINSGEAKILLNKDGINIRKLESHPKMKEKLVKFQNESNFEERKLSNRMRGLRDEGYSQNLEDQAPHFMKKVAVHLNEQRGLSKERINLTPDQKTYLLHCFKTVLKYKGDQMKLMQELFIRKYPQYADLSYNALHHQLTHIWGRNTGIEEKTGTLHHSWEPGEASRMKKQSFIPLYQSHDLDGGSDQNIVLNQDTSRSHHVFGGPSFSGHHNLPDVGTSHQLPLPGTSGDHSGRDSAQDRTDRKERKSSKGKEPELDLDLHLR